MKIGLVEKEKKGNELFFEIVDMDTNTNVGILFIVGRSIAYEVYPEFRRQGIATEALKKITSKINRPTLEITRNNITSKKVAHNAGYKLVGIEGTFEIYEYPNQIGKTK